MPGSAGWSDTAIHTGEMENQPARRPETADLAVAAAGVLTLIFGGPLVASTSPSTTAAIFWAISFYAVCVCVLQWESGRPARVPWARVDTVLSVASLIGVTFIMSQLIWPSVGAESPGAWVASVVAGGTLASFVGVRWRH